MAESGPIDGLVYCVGIGNNRPLNLTTPEEFASVQRVNLNAFVETVRCFTRRGRFNPGLRIVVISSVASLHGEKAQLSYAASKAGINAAVFCMADELARKQVFVNALLPGMIDTEMYQRYLRTTGGVEGASNQRLLRRQYLGIGEVRDVAMAAAFFVSPAAQISGAIIPVDGGQISNLGG